MKAGIAAEGRVEFFYCFVQEMFFFCRALMELLVILLASWKITYLFLTEDRQRPVLGDGSPTVLC